ncbi:hypothetical protein [Cereibacter johrii]|uniref:hypothetical protein n=1 Tax=Cereibacter johrii TaxID=445629 RepID=UPI000DCD4536|nr:hypothetical protein [Cereibacter johrii]RAZ83436.1 hypothetical protein DDV93_14090 [Cereibacter johrii]
MSFVERPMSRIVRSVSDARRRCDKIRWMRSEAEAQRAAGELLDDVLFSINAGLCGPAHVLAGIAEEACQWADHKVH